MNKPKREEPVQVVVSGKHLEVTEPIRAYAVEKMTKLPRYFDRVSQVEVLVDKGEGKRMSVEAIVHAEGSAPFIARTQDEDLYACIDQAADKLERQLTDHKEKRRSHK